MSDLLPFTFDYPSERIGKSLILEADCFEWLRRVPENSFHAIVTDPPYDVKEYQKDQIEKRQNGKGGIWRIPPAFDGHERAPLPRFTVLTRRERTTISEFFTEWAKLVLHAIRPGGHIFIASSSFLSQLVFSALVEGGLEFRGQLIRLELRTGLTALFHRRVGPRTIHAYLQAAQAATPASATTIWRVLRRRQYILPHRPPQRMPFVRPPAGLH